MAGAQVVEVRTPMIEELAATYPQIVGAEAYATHAAGLAARPACGTPFAGVRLRVATGSTAGEYYRLGRALAAFTGCDAFSDRRHPG